MITIFDKGEIINLKERGMSNRAIAKTIGVDRKTVARVWSKHLKLSEQLKSASSDDEKRKIQQQIVDKPKYDTSNRLCRKYTEAMDAVIDELLDNEKIKDSKLGNNHKQKLTYAMVHEILLSRGFDIGLSTVSNVVREKRNKFKETFIRQTYIYGQRLEFDFGEVKLIINGEYQKFYIAVLSSPASNYRVAYLYTTQCKDVFMDAHVKFFDSVGGVYDEVVYDNMRNVVSKFIGRNEKVLNEDLVKLSMYYGFNINVTNCFSGNEKGHVEGSVKVIRKRAFAINYEFDSFDDACSHLNKTICKLNEDSTIEEEKQYLKSSKPKLELAKITKNTVNKYSVVRVENNYYSVPEYLNGKDVTIKNYLNDIEIYFKQEFVCKHKKVDGFLEYVLDINHYIQTLKIKPGAIKNSQALICNPELKSIYNTYYTTKPKLFIELIENNKHLSKEELNDVLVKSYDSKIVANSLEDKIIDKSNASIGLYTKLLRSENYGIN